MTKIYVPCTIFPYKRYIYTKKNVCKQNFGVLQLSQIKKYINNNFEHFLQHILSILTFQNNKQNYEILYL